MTRPCETAFGGARPTLPEIHSKHKAASSGEIQRTQPYYMPLDGSGLRYDPDTIHRLHSSPIRNLSRESVKRELIPRHLLTGELPDFGRPLKSTDYFSKGKAGEGRIARKPPLHFAHEYHIIQRPDKSLLMNYKRGINSKNTPLRIVSHKIKGYPFPKKMPEMMPIGISRNVSGGFYTS